MKMRANAAQLVKDLPMVLVLKDWKMKGEEGYRVISAEARH